MAVASEPYIFWKGEKAHEIIDKISIPKELGRLEPSSSIYNGPSGITLDEQFLKPLGVSRQESWLCDLLPYSRINSNQRKALVKHYEPEVSFYNLPRCTIPDFSEFELKNQRNRHIEILKEIRKSQCDTIMLLGDLPIKYWLKKYYFSSFKKLSDFGDTSESYGKLHSIKIEGKNYNVLPLVHPRQAGNLGKSSKKWNELHKQWVLKQSHK